MSGFRGQPFNAFASVGLAIAAIVALIVVGNPGPDLPLSLIALDVATGLVAGVGYGLLTGYFDRPYPDGGRSLLAINSLPAALAVGIVMALLNHQFDASMRFMLLALVLGGGIGNAAGLLFWRIRRQSLESQ